MLAYIVVKHQADSCKKKGDSCKKKAGSVKLLTVEKILNAMVVEADNSFTVDLLNSKCGVPHMGGL